MEDQELDPDRSVDPDAAWAATFRPVIGWLQEFERGLRSEVAVERERAASAARRLADMESRFEELHRAAQAEAAALTGDARSEAARLVDDAREEAACIIDEARAEASGMVEAARLEAARLEAASLRGAGFRSGDRERKLMHALREYVLEIGVAQETLLGVARQALGVDRRRGDTTATSGEVASEESSDGSGSAVPDRDRDPFREPATGSEGTGPEAEPQHEVPPAIHLFRAEQPAAADLRAALPVTEGERTDEHRLIDLHNRHDLARLHTRDRGWGNLIQRFGR